MMPGMIMGWPWSIESIPSGWHLCDGTMGTPDYRNYYLVCAGDEYEPGESFGSNTHTHTFTGDSHWHQIDPGTQWAEGEGPLLKIRPVIITGTTDTGDSRPQSKAINWIMKL